MDDDGSAELAKHHALEEEIESYISRTLECLAGDELDARLSDRIDASVASGEVFRISGPAEGVPVFQFDDKLDAIPVVAEINRLLDVSREPSAAASWWVTPHARLDGSAPYELAGVPEAAERLLTAARASISIDY